MMWRGVIRRKRYYHKFVHLLWADVQDSAARYNLGDGPDLQSLIKRLHDMGPTQLLAIVNAAERVRTLVRDGMKVIDALREVGLVEPEGQGAPMA